MRKLIILPGRMDCPFFLNELEILTREFDKVVIISYPISVKKREEIIQRYNIACYIINEKRISLSVIRRIVRWIKTEEVKRELKEHFAWSKKGLLRVVYIFVYGLFAVQAYEIIEKEINDEPDDAEITLYSYWLSRPAYAVSYFYSQYKGRAKKAVSRAHGYDLYEYRNHLEYLPFRSFIDCQLDTIFFISKSGKQYYLRWREKLPRDEKKANLSVNYLGTYNETRVQKRILEKTTVVVASCSSIIPVKRLDLIISTLEHITDIKIKWIHIGDGEFYKEMQESAHRKLKHVDTVFMGEVDNKEILNIYTKEDVDYFINLSDSEGLPVSIMEAMSVGIPAIARDVGGIREIVNSQTGCLIEDVQNYKEIHDFLALRIKQKEQYLKYSQEALHFWKNNFDGAKNYERFVKEIG